MKQIRLRVEVTAEDKAPIEAVQTRLREILNGIGVESVGTPAAEDDLGGAIPAARVFWMTADIKQGADREPTTVTKRRGKP